jgi:hypothetical protein
MVAMMITLFALLGLLKGVEIAAEQNLRNNVRDEMVQVAEDRLNRFRAMPFSATFNLISSCQTTPSNAGCPAAYSYAPEAVPSQLRGVSMNYTVVRTTVVTSDGSAANLGVKVDWTYKGSTYSHEAHAVKVMGQ